MNKFLLTQAISPLLYSNVTICCGGSVGLDTLTVLSLDEVIKQPEFIFFYFRLII